jgi:hypothetical protein
MFDDIPTALTPIYNSEVNEAIPLFQGELNFIDSDQKINGYGALEFHWYPYPGIWFKVDLYGFTSIQSSEPTLEIPKLNIQTKARITRSFYGNKFFVEGQLAPFDIGNGDKISYVIFHITNFSDYIGTNIQDETKLWKGEITLESEEWRITIDTLSKWKEIHEALKNRGGYAITNVAKLERIDGQTFTSEEAENILFGLNHFLSFVAGRWICPILPSGFDRDNNKIWEKWSYRKLQSYQPGKIISWLPEHSPSDLTTAFKGFMKKYLDPDWQESLRLLVYLYVESNNAGCEQAIITIQSAFELLAWLILVEQYKILSKEGIEKLPAFELLRLLFHSLQIPLELPQPSDQFYIEELHKMSKMSKAENYSDSPKCITVVRNKIIHPKRTSDKEGKAKPILTFSSPIHREASLLSLWYLEMCLLKIFEYEGVYANRLRKNRWAGNYDPLPWQE